MPSYYLFLIFLVYVLVFWVIVTGRDKYISRWLKWLKSWFIGPKMMFWIDLNEAIHYAREGDDRWKTAETVIEIKRVLFWKRGRVIGPGGDSWQIRKIRGDVWASNLRFELQWCSRADPGYALGLIKVHPKQKKRIAELEKELADKKNELRKSECQRKWLRAYQEVIFQTLNEDRERYRSRFSEALRLFFENSRKYTSDLEAPGEVLLENCRNDLKFSLQRAFVRKPVRT